MACAGKARISSLWESMVVVVLECLQPVNLAVRKKGISESETCSPCKCLVLFKRQERNAVVEAVSDKMKVVLKVVLFSRLPNGYDIACIEAMFGLVF